MRAIVCTKYGPPEVLELRDVTKPAPKNNEVLIKIRTTAVTATDCILRRMKITPSLKKPMTLVAGLMMGFDKPRRPIFGLVLSGVVESVGKNVTQFKAGDPVFASTMTSPMKPRFGAHAEYICLPEDGIIALKPATLSDEEAAAIPYGGMLALHFLRLGGIQRGQNVLIYGASGATGTAAVQLAKHFGATVTGVCSTTNLDLVKSLGADAVIDYTQEDFTKSGERYDLILNAVGKRKAKLQCENSLTPTGKHITIDDGSPTFQIEDFLLLKTLAETGALKAVIDRCYPLEEMIAAHRYVDLGHKKGNVVITV